MRIYGSLPIHVTRAVPCSQGGGREFARLDVSLRLDRTIASLFYGGTVHVGGASTTGTLTYGCDNARE